MANQVLITGGTGLLGLNWAKAMASTHRVTLCCHRRFLDIPFATCERVNLETFSDCLAAFEQIKPSLIINAAGLADVDRCQSNPREAYRANSLVARNIAKAAQFLGVKLVHISTDHLSDGKVQFVSETADICPLNVYAKTKAAGEKFVLNECKNSLVIRTNFFGWGPFYRRSFSDLIYDALTRKKEIVLFQDVFFTPILIGTLIDTVQKLVDVDASGIFNVCGSERISKHEFGIRLASHFGLPSDLIQSGISINSNRVVRPLDLSLSNSKVEKVLMIKIDALNQQFNALRRQALGYPFGSMS